MRKVLITGATSGFGKLLVEAFLRNGDMVLATGRNLTTRQDILAIERAKYPGKLVEYSLDITNKNEVTFVSQTVAKEFGSLDILVNNAGYGLFGALEDLKEEEIRYQMEVNFFGTVSVTQALLPLLRKSKGKIFNFSSVFGFMGFPLTSVYCASKYAIEGLTESLRGELAPHGVQVCLIQPGGYRTNFGGSIAWGDSRSESPYHLQSSNYQALRIKFAEKNSQDPAEVSKGVLKLSLQSKMPMRKVFGKDGKASLIMKSLPSVLYWLVMDIANRKIFLKAKSQ
jgi:NAD(P)-dependent dehydrogenase (short-subunit alcohol dehydrogenase family)